MGTEIRKQLPGRRERVVVQLTGKGNNRTFCGDEMFHTCFGKWFYKNTQCQNISKLHQKCKEVFLFIKIQFYFCYHLCKTCIYLSVFRGVNLKRKFNDYNIDYPLKVTYSLLDDQCYR